jgi:hypothetical protein
MSVPQVQTVWSSFRATLWRSPASMATTEYRSIRSPRNESRSLYFRIYALRYLEEIFGTTRRRRFVEGMKMPSAK